MVDTHLYPDNWGVRPILLRIFGIGVSSYSFFVLIGLLVGVFVYCYEAKRNRQQTENSFYIFVAALFGGILGAKIPVWIMNYREIISSFPDLGPFFSGRTVVGGLIGGTISVKIVKRILKIKEKRGNLFAPAIALGLSIGRIGCFLRGCCYGKISLLPLPWAVDFGDGLLRHPTQVYESFFCLLLFGHLTYLKRKVTEPGRLFVIFLNYYFSFRFFVEFIRVEPVVFFRLTGFQIVSLLVLVYLNRGLLTRYRKLNLIRGGC
ncbi:MAG: prolipoprotein diacylglyceryl transferase [Candidatus Omnitrophica bacterium]|nr:prolipoprotein diacylglyceryl transferase [Candidatus Omnitrophota bacterium]